MKRFIPFLLILVVLTACAAPTGTPVPSTRPAQPTELLPTAIPPTPFPDTPAPPQIGAPLVESPALVAIHFVNSLDGWGVTETQILRTNDGGITWYNVTPPDVTETGYSVDVIVLDNDHVWMQKPDLENYPNNGFLYRTSDGGMTWTNTNTPFSGGNIQFLDANNGWALADLGVGAGSQGVAIYQTTDGGATWTQKYTNDPNTANAADSLPLGGLKAGIAPLSMQTAWVYGVIYAQGTPYLYRTDDGGATWNAVTLPLPPDAQNFELGIDQDQMKFVSSTDGFIAVRFTGDTYQLAVYVTNDGGNTWSLTPTMIPNGGSADFMSAGELAVYNGDQFYVTHDAAATWNIIPPDVKFNNIFAGMSFADSTTGWVVTLDSSNHRSLYRSTDGGKTWSPLVP